MPSGLACFPFARRYLGNRFFFLFLRVLRCFTSPGALRWNYEFIPGCLDITPDGFPHSDIRESQPAYGSSRLFAVSHVLLRRMVPGHPPCALLSLGSLCVCHDALVLAWFVRLFVRRCVALTRRSAATPSLARLAATENSSQTPASSPAILTYFNPKTMFLSLMFPSSEQK